MTDDQLDITTMPLFELDGLIAFHSTTLKDMIAERNARSLTYRIPPELLSAIFVWFMKITLDDIHWPRRSQSHTHRSFGGSRLVHTHPVPWVVVSQVSSHWRAIALDCVPLWNKIFLGQERWTELQLSRSKDAALYIQIDPRISGSAALFGYKSTLPALLNPPSIKSLHRIFSQASHRIVSLEIPVDDGRRSSHKLGQLMSSSVLTSLKRLRLIRDSRSIWSDPITGQSDENPSGTAVLQEIMVKPGLELQVLHLHGFKAAAWVRSNFSLANLTRLSITECPDLLPDDLLPLLDRIPRLATLTLANSLPRDEWASETKPIMSSLRRLSIGQSHVASVASFLENVDFPIGIRVSLDCLATSHPPGATAILADTLFRFIHALSPYLQRLNVTDSSTDEGKTKGVKPYRTLLYSMVNGSLNLAFSSERRLEYQAPSFGQHRIFHTLGQSMESLGVDFTISLDQFFLYGERGNELIIEVVRPNVQAISALVIVDGMDGNAFWSCGSWMKMFGQLEKVRTVHVKLTKTAQQRFLGVLDPAVRTDHDVDEDHPTLTFPSLERLTLRSAWSPFDVDLPADNNSSGHSATPSAQPAATNNPNTAFQVWLGNQPVHGANTGPGGPMAPIPPNLLPPAFVHFNALNAGFPHPPLAPPAPHTRSLLTILLAREALDSSLKVLGILETPDVTPELVNKLKATVKEVQWDGKTRILERMSREEVLRLTEEGHWLDLGIQEVVGDYLL